MQNGIIIDRLKKDIAELQLLIEGFSSFGTLPPFLSKLAIRKANDIIEGLEQLGGEGIPKTPEPAKEKIEQKESIPDTENIPASKPYAVQQPVQPKPKQPEPKAEPKAEPRVEPKTEPQIAAEDSFARLREMLNNHPKRTLADTFNSASSLSNKLENASIDDLRKALSINDKFRFQKALFGNSADRLNETLEAINNMNSATEAEFYLKRNVTLAPDSDRSVLDELVTLVKRRFT